MDQRHLRAYGNNQGQKCMCGQWMVHRWNYTNTLPTKNVRDWVQHPTTILVEYRLGDIEEWRYDTRYHLVDTDDSDRIGFQK